MKKEYDFSLAERGPILVPSGKTHVAMYIDDGVLATLRLRAEKAGKGYQTLINETLMASLEPESVSSTVRRARVSRDSEVMSGALVFTGTRVPVKTIFDHLQGGESLAEIISPCQLDGGRSFS